MLYVSGQLPTYCFLSVCLFCTVNKGYVEHFLTTKNHMECRKRQETQRGLCETLSLLLAQERAVPQNVFSFACPSPFSPLLVVVQPPKAAQRMMGSSCCFLLRFSATRRLILWNILPSGRFTKRDSRSYICNYNLISFPGVVDPAGLDTGTESISAAKSSSGVRAFLLRLHRRRLLRICLFVGG